MASPGTFSIIIDARGLGALCQAEPQHQWTQQQPGHAARVRLLFSAAAWGFLPCQSHPWLPEPWQRTDCTSREITLEQCSHPRISTEVRWLTLERMGGPCVRLRDLGLLPRSPSLQDASQKMGPRIEKRVLGFSPSPLPPPHPYNTVHPIQPRKHLWIKWPLPAG